MRTNNFPNLFKVAIIVWEMIFIFFLGAIALACSQKKYLSNINCHIELHVKQFLLIYAINNFIVLFPLMHIVTLSLNDLGLCNFNTHRYFKNYILSINAKIIDIVILTCFVVFSCILNLLNCVIIYHLNWNYVSLPYIQCSLITWCTFVAYVLTFIIKRDNIIMINEIKQLIYLIKRN